jgi:hypothetical protein
VRHTLKRLIKRVGWPVCERALRDTRDIEESGGLWSVHEKRRRSIGGTFFALLKDRSVEARWMLFHLQVLQRQKAERSAAALAEPPFTWEQRGEFVREILVQPGQAMTAKLTLIGRPEKVIQRQDFVVTALEYRGNPSFPKGLPVPKSMRATYTVYIAAKQWQKVAALLKNAEDQLIVEGFCMGDPESGGIVVFAQSVTTKVLQRQKIAQQRAAGAAAPEHGVSPPEPPAAAGVERAPGAPAAVAPAPSLPAAPAPPSDEEQVRSLLRQRFAGAEALEPLATRAGVPFRQLQLFYEERPTTLTPAQIRTFLQKLRQALR